MKKETRFAKPAQRRTDEGVPWHRHFGDVRKPMTDELDARVREAYRMTAAPVAVDSYELATAIELLRAAFVRERAMRMLAEFSQDHEVYPCQSESGRCCTECGSRNFDPRHGWNDEQWKASVEKEMSREGLARER
jgi:hypothetical protein